MKLSDCPHAVGTPEHSEWVKTVYIPTVAPERSRLDRERAGAESIGVKLDRGVDFDRLRAELERLTTQSIAPLSFVFQTVTDQTAEFKRARLYGPGVMKLGGQTFDIKNITVT